MKIPAAVRREVLVRTYGLCACGCGARAVHCHHVFTTQRWPELGKDPRNLVGLAMFCHFAHHAALPRLARSVVALAEQLAVTGAMANYLDRFYPAA